MKPKIDRASKFLLLVYPFMVYQQYGIPAMIYRQIGDKYVLTLPLLGILKY